MCRGVHGSLLPRISQHCWVPSCRGLETSTSRHPLHPQNSKILTERQPGNKYRGVFSKGMFHILQAFFILKTWALCAHKPQNKLEISISNRTLESLLSLEVTHKSYSEQIPCLFGKLCHCAQKALSGKTWTSSTKTCCSMRWACRKARWSCNTNHGICGMNCLQGNICSK